MLNSAEFLCHAPADTEVLLSVPEGSGLPELGWSRYAAQRTWWKLTHRLKGNLPAPPVWRRRNAADAYPVELRGKSQKRTTSLLSILY